MRSEDRFPGQAELWAGYCDASPTQSSRPGPRLLNDGGVPPDAWPAWKRTMYAPFFAQRNQDLEPSPSPRIEAQRRMRDAADASYALRTANPTTRTSPGIVSALRELWRRAIGP